tara:strand:- start:6287 stop:7369 length:1083 start_codon:yes stop_codon:yes gene_type:complete
MINRRNVLIGAGMAATGGAALWALSPGPDYDGLAASIRESLTPADDLQTLAGYATLAANSHNTQPWLFAQDGSAISIAPDFTRETPVVDANHHHVFASLGCAAENLALAAGAAGKPAAVAYSDRNEGGVMIDLGSSRTVRDPLFDAITKRQCTRSLYDGRAVETDDLASIEKAAALSGARVLIVTDPKKIEEVLEMVVAANTAQVEDPAFRAELKQWLRFSPRRAVEARDGLYSACSGNPTLPDWLGRLLFDFVFTAKGENDRYAAWIRSSAGLAIVVSDANDKPHWVEAGMACQRFALAATALGIRHAFINQPLEVPEKRLEFGRWLGDDSLSPDMILRFGHAEPMPWSLRRPVDEVIA